MLIEFYIWNEGGAADEVLEALVRAGGRGVSCRVLVDAVGARPWWSGRQPQRLREAGVQVQPALPVSLLQALVSRNDLRLHRKIVVVDGRVAWTGSMNLVDPRYFKHERPRRAVGRCHGPPGRIGRGAAGHDHDRRLDAGNGRTD